MNMLKKLGAVGCLFGVASVFAVSPADYAKKMVVTVNPSACGYRSAAVADVPVAIRLSTGIAGFSYGDLAEDGSDLLFTDINGNRLSHQIERWDAAGESVVWVRVPKFAPGERIVAYYKGPTNGENVPSEVWTAFSGVWHMDEASGSVADASENDREATPIGESAAESVATDGVIGKARLNATNGGRSSLQVANTGDGALQFGGKFTFSGWFKVNDVNSDGQVTFVTTKQRRWDGSGWGIRLEKGTSDVLLYRGAGDAGWQTLGIRNVVDFKDNWVHLAVTYSGNTARMHINGQFVQSVQMGDYTPTTWVQTPTDSNNPLTFGFNANDVWDDGWSRALHGSYDELRIGAGVMDADRIAAEYAAQLPGVVTCVVTDVDSDLYAAPVLTNFRKRFDISAADASVGSYSDFAMLVRLSPERVSGFSYADFMQPDGTDIAFFDGSGKPLAFDVDTWNPSGESLVWVKVPDFSSSTVITCAYGGLVRNDVHQPATWSRYRGVWHLNESGNGVQAIRDATANALDGSSHADTKHRADGQLGGSRIIAESRTTKGNILIPYKDALNLNERQTNFTFTTWINLTSGGNWGAFLCSRMNEHLDPGWGVSFCAWEMNNLDIYYRGKDLADMDVQWTNDNGGYWKTFSNEHPGIGARDVEKGSWHRYTVFLTDDGSKLICKTYLDGQKKGENWMHHYPKGAPHDDSGRSYGHLYQAEDRGLALGGLLQDGNYSLYGAMDEVRLSNHSMDEGREAAEFAQESQAAFYGYSAVSDVEGSQAPTMATVAKELALEVGADGYSLTVRGSVEKLEGASAVVRLVAGRADSGHDPLAAMQVVAEKTVSSVGAVTFDFAGVLGTKVVCRLEIENVLDATHSVVSASSTAETVLNDSGYYEWIANGNGLWSDAANWRREGDDDGKPHVGYPSYGSGFAFYGNQTDVVHVDGAYVGLRDSCPLGWDGADITFIGDVEGALLDVGGFRDGQYDNIRVTLDNVAFTKVGSWHVKNNAALTLRNGASITAKWEVTVEGTNARLCVGEGCSITAATTGYYPLGLAGQNASIEIDDGTIAASYLDIGHNKPGETPSGIVISGAKASLTLRDDVVLSAQMPGTPAITFVMPENGFENVPIVKTGDGGNDFLRRADGVTGQVLLNIDRASPYYAAGGAALDQTLVDWKRGGHAINLEALTLKARRGSFVTRPEGASAVNELLVRLENKIGTLILLR